VIAFFVYFPDRFLLFHDKELGMQIADLPLVSESFNYFDYSLLSFVPYSSIDLKKVLCFRLLRCF